MKNLISVVCAAIVFFPAISVNAASSTYLDEMRGLGELSGSGLACNAAKYDQFELLARAYLRSEASSDEEEDNGLREYTRAKVSYYRSTQMNGFSDCAKTREIFDNQLIFKSVLYGDGTIKTPDGKIITPRKPYDARKLYVKDPDIYKKIKEIQDNARERNKSRNEAAKKGQIVNTRPVKK